MKNIFLHNVGLKLLSALLALLLWLTVMNVEDPTVTATITDIPVQIVNDDVIKSRGYSYNVESGEKVDVKIKGRRSVVDNITAEDFTATADFNAFSSMKMVPIEVKCIDEHATEITWTAKTDSMAIVLEAEDTASKSIRIEREGTVKEGYYLYECTTDTSLVSVKGAASQVANVKEVVAKVDIEGIKDSGDPEIPLYAVDEEGQIIDAKKITLVPDTVTVHLTINPIKEVPLSVYTTGNPGLYYYVGDIEFAPETIKVTATAEVLNNLEKLDVEVKLGNAEEDIESQINLEEYIDQYYRHLGIKVVDSSATMMGIKVPVIKMTEMTLDIKPEDINIIGTDESLKYTIQQQMYGFTPKIVVRGKAEELENIEASDFGLFINVTGLGKGSQSIQVECNYDGDLILEPGKVNLVIEEKPTPTPTENESNANQDREIQ